MKHPSRHNLAPARRAFTLVELLVAISIIAVVMAVLSSILYLLLSRDRQSDARARQQLSLSRLNTRFRDDLARATSIQVRGAGDPEPGFTLTDGPASIRWSAQPNGLLRIRSAPESPPSRDFLWLGSGLEVAWDWNPENRLASLTLRIPRVTLPDSNSRRPQQAGLEDTLTITATPRALVPPSGGAP